MGADEHDPRSVDMHVHGGFSVDNDRISPQEWVEHLYWTKDNELPDLEAVALTDHNNMVGVEPTIDALRKYENSRKIKPLELIAGVECGLEHENVSVHIVSYFLPREGEDIRDMLHMAEKGISPLLESIDGDFTRRKYGINALEMVNAYMRNERGNIDPITIEEMDAVMREGLPDYKLDNWIFSPTKEGPDRATIYRITELNHRQLAELIFRRGWVNELRDAKALTAREGALYPQNFPGYDLCKGVETIHRSGAFASLAHPQITIKDLCEKNMREAADSSRIKFDNFEPLFGNINEDRNIKYATLDKVLVEFQTFIEEELIPRGLKGIEVINSYSYLKAEFAYMTQSLLMFVSDYNSRHPDNKICITGGSDFHSKDAKGRKLGQVRTISSDGISKIEDIYHSKIRPAENRNDQRFDNETMDEIYAVLNESVRNSQHDALFGPIPYRLLEAMKKAKRDPDSGLYVLPITQGLVT